MADDDDDDDDDDVITWLSVDVQKMSQSFKPGLKTK